jgi:ABC-type branched-subunit amino acid transport system substrate-binding protein
VKSRSAALLALIVLAGSACGARLSPDQRRSALEANANGGAATASLPQGAGRTSPVSFERTSGADGVGANGVAGGSGSKDCAASGPLTASDTGVTPGEIRLGTVSDVSGVVPGLALSTFQAMQAAAAYINSQGGICGRRVVLDLRDDQTTANGNKASTQEACAQDFALVGSFSAFDDGGASTVEQMKCPDMSAFTTTAERGQSNPYTYAVYPNRPDYFVVASANYVKRTYPDVVKNAAIVWLNAGVAAVNARARIKGYESAGFRFVYQEPAAVLETSYTPFVVEMKNHNPPVKFFTMVADTQSIVRMLQAMDQQDWYPKTMQFDLQVYTPQFLDLAQGAGEGALFWLNSAMFEEAAKYPEMRLYLEWLQRVTPGAEPDTFGLFAWSAGRLFQQLATGIGPNLTRAKLVAALNRTTAWTGHGLHPPMDVAHRLPAGCELFGQVQNDRYVRRYPSTGFDCNGGLAHLT